MATGGMDSGKLSAREKQPGHDRTFVTSETNFIEAAAKCLDSDRFQLTANPSELRDVFSEPGEKVYGLVPEAMIASKTTGRKLFVEVKKQGAAGNADERACRHHTVQFYKTMNNRYGYGYHPYVTIFCERLADMTRYTQKMRYVLEPKQYFCWEDYDLDALCRYLNARCQEWLED